MSRGIGDKYSFNPAPIEDDPVEPNDLLDDWDKPVESRRTRRPVAEQVQPARAVESTEVAAQPKAPALARHLEVIEGNKAPLPRRERIQINLNQKGKERFDTLLSFLAETGPQSDIKHSEVMEAMLEILYDARKGIDVSNLQPRGGWGKPTAAAFITGLGKAFAKAITSQHAEFAAPKKRDIAV